tara:strand:+ start:2176 stop:2424 length:249 start_codon:yes stop_codon:yes gene_type:complete
MPRDILEIKNFNVGTIISPDIKDIPVEAASYSLNIDSVTEDGKLKGVPNDTLRGEGFSAPTAIVTLGDKTLVLANGSWGILE